jgi:hypothetical protein
MSQHFWGLLNFKQLLALALAIELFIGIALPKNCIAEPPRLLSETSLTDAPEQLEYRSGDLLCFYVDPNKLDSKVIQANPSAPRQLGAKNIVKPFGCKRDFRYEGKLYSIDSFNRADGEHLRPYVESIPEAVSLLNTYQTNKRNVQNVAYIGTAGLLLALTGILFSKQISETNQSSVRNVLVFSGLGIMVGSAVYAVNSLINNEENLLNAVKKHNTVKSKTPIEIQFGASLLF